MFVRVEFVGPSLKTVGAQCAVDSFSLVSVTCAGCEIPAIEVTGC